MKEVQTNAAATIKSDPSLRILKIASCPSLSGQSSLTYHLGCNAESEIHFRIFANSSSGYFSQEWVSADSIGKALGESINITSFTLQSIYVGKSQNNGGFLLAALFSEGLVNRSSDNERQYQLGNPDAFNAEVKALMESSVALDPDAKPKKVKKSA